MTQYIDFAIDMFNSQNQDKEDYLFLAYTMFLKTDNRKLYEFMNIKRFKEKYPNDITIDNYVRLLMEYYCPREAFDGLFYFKSEGYYQLFNWKPYNLQFEEFDKTINEIKTKYFDYYIFESIANIVVKKIFKLFLKCIQWSKVLKDKYHY